MEITIQDFMVDPETRARMAFLTDAAKYGMSPFLPREICFWNDFDIDFNRERFMVEVRGPNWRYDMFFYVDRMDLLDDDWVWKAYPKIVRGFRERPDDPIPLNVELGEN